MASFVVLLPHFAWFLAVSTFLHCFIMEWDLINNVQVVPCIYDPPRNVLLIDLFLLKKEFQSSKGLFCDFPPSTPISLFYLHFCDLQKSQNPTITVEIHEFTSAVVCLVCCFGASLSVWELLFVLPDVCALSFLHKPVKPEITVHNCGW